MHGGVPGSAPDLVAFFRGVNATDACLASIYNDSPTLFPLGTTPVTFTATDLAGNVASCTASVVVVDTVAPTIALTLDRTSLWPPNHKLVSIAASVSVQDICDASPRFVLTSIVSSEPDNSLGDGDTSGDVQDAAYGTPDTVFRVRAERSGVGNGRTYSILYTASDSSG